MSDKKYIEVNDLLKHLPNEPDKGAIRRVLQQAHAADVASVVRGLWERVDSSYYRWTPSGGTLVDCATYRCNRCGRGTAVKSN